MITFNIVKIQELKDFLEINLLFRLETELTTRRGLDVQEDECIIGVVNPSLVQYAKDRQFKFSSEVLK